VANISTCLRGEPIHQLTSKAPRGHDAGSLAPCVTSDLALIGLLKRLGRTTVEQSDRGSGLVDVRIQLI